MGNSCCGLHDYNYNYNKSSSSSSSMVWGSDYDHEDWVSVSDSFPKINDSIPNNKKRILHVEKRRLLSLDDDQNQKESSSSSSSSSGNNNNTHHNREVKIKISKKQLQELLSGDDIPPMDDDNVLCRLLKFKASEMNNCDQPSVWKPVLHTIPELN